MRSTSPRGAIATTPSPFAMDLVPTGLAVVVANAGGSISPITSIATRKKTAGQVCVNIGFVSASRSGKAYRSPRRRSLMPVQSQQLILDRYNVWRADP